MKTSVALTLVGLLLLAAALLLPEADASPPDPPDPCVVGEPPCVAQYGST